MQSIRDAVVATTVRVGVRNGHRVEDVLSAPAVHAALRASVLRTLARSRHLTGNPAIGVNPLLGETMRLTGSEGLIASAAVPGLKPAPLNDGFPPGDHDTDLDRCFLAVALRAA